jgi:hypothetical protein
MHGQTIIVTLPCSVMAGGGRNVPPGYVLRIDDEQISYLFMRNFLIILFVSRFSLHSFTVSAFTVTDTILYEQKVFRDDRMFKDIFRTKKGTLYLTDQQLEFKSHRPTHARFDFSIPYGQIKSIRTYYGFIIPIPNRIKIKTISSERFRLFTYKRRKIIRITREQMAKF